MKAIKIAAFVLGAYVVLIVAFEALVGVMGARQAANGVQPGQGWLVISTTDARGSHDTVVAGVELDGQLYVAANHWPRQWYHRAIANPDVEVTRDGSRATYRALPVAGEELERVERGYVLPWPVRFLTGFPPREFLHLVPRPET